MRSRSFQSLNIFTWPDPEPPAYFTPGPNRSQSGSRYTLKIRGSCWSCNFFWWQGFGAGTEQFFLELEPLS